MIGCAQERVVIGCPGGRSDWDTLTHAILLIVANCVKPTTFSDTVVINV